jgi:hypothetical protein
MAMKYNLKYIFLSLLIACACTDEENENVGKGESINEFTLKNPQNFSVLSLNPSTPDKNFVVEWNAAETGLNGAPTYSFLLDVKGGDFSSPLLEVEADDDGEATTASLLYSQISSAIAGATGTEFIWIVRATTINAQGENNKLARSPFQLEILGSQYGVTEFAYVTPAVNKKVFLDKVRTPNDDIVISWESATPSAGTISYRFLAATTANGFNNPVIDLPSDNSGTSTSFTLTHTEWVETLSNITYKDGLYWKIVASVTVGGNIVYTYSPETRFMWFEIFDVPTLYIVGSLTDNWNNTCGATIEMVNKGGGVFEKLVSIPANAEFKFVLQCGSWDVNWGGPGGTASSNTDYALGSNNIGVANAGSYFVRVDFSTGTFKLVPFTPPTNLYLVGGATSAGWNPGNSIPFVNMGNNKFEIYAYLNADGFKFLEVQDWAGDWGVKGGTSTTNNGVITAEVVQEGEENATSPSAGFYRITVDFGTVSYKLEPMNWGIIGSATAGGWDADTDMTFVGGSGSYKWTITANLTVGEMKFRANDDWGVNFGDNGANGSLEYGSDNIAIGSAGNYTIELILDPVNGYTYTVTLNP